MTVHADSIHCSTLLYYENMFRAVFPFLELGEKALYVPISDTFPKAIEPPCFSDAEWAFDLIFSIGR